MPEAALNVDDEKIVVAIEPEVQADAEPKRNPDGTFAKAEPVEPVDDLKAQFDALKSENVRITQRATDETRRRTEAERIAAQAREDAAGARSEAIESHASTVESGLDAAKAEADAAEREYVSAVETGDAAKQAQAQRKIARAEAKISRLDEAKADLDVRRAKTEEPKRKLERRPTADDPVETFIAGRSPETAEWFRAHPDWASAMASGIDNPKARKLNAAHATAVAEEIDPDTPEYFAHVEKFIGLKNGAAVKETPKPARKQGAPVAPGGANGGGGGGGREVTLTRGEATSATDGTIVWNYDDPSGQKRFKKGDVIGHQEMARRKLEMTKQGQYDRTYTEQ